MTVNSRVIKVFLGWSPDAVDVPLMNGLRVQILPTIEDLPRARKHQFAAFIASEAILVVWDDDALHLIQRAKAIESELMELVWQTGEPGEAEEGVAKKGPTTTTVEIDEESGAIMPQNRPTHLLNTILVGLTLILIVTVLGAGFRELAIEVAVDHSYLRLAFVALTPVQIFFTLVRTSIFRFWVGCILTLGAVLCPSHCWLSCSVHRSRPSNDTELEIFLGLLFTSSSRSNPSSCDHSMSSVQRGPALRDCSYR